MSRPKLPQLSWRQLRVASTAALAVLLTTAYVGYPTDAEPEGPAPRPAALAPSLTLLDQTTGVGHLTTALQAQAAAQAEAHRQAVEKARKAQQERKARERAAAAAARERAQAAERERARERQAEQHTARSAQRTTLATTTATVSGARGYARSRMSSSQYQCLTNLVSRESGWNHRAVNPSSGAYGLFQALPGSKMASAGSDWRYNPLTQMRWGLSYIKARYGTPCGAWYFWTKNRWY